MLHRSSLWEINCTFFALYSFAYMQAMLHNLKSFNKRKFARVFWERLSHYYETSFLMGYNQKKKQKKQTKQKKTDNLDCQW